MEATLLTCKKCGSTDLHYEKNYDLVENFQYTLKCDCDSTHDGIAAEYDKIVTTSYKDWENGSYDEAGDWIGTGQETEEIESDEETDNEETNCQDCYEVADELEWKSEKIGEPEEINIEEHTRCSKCEQEFDLKEAMNRVDQ